MRLFPPVSSVGRVLAKPTEIAGFKMPAGTSVGVGIYMVHHHPDFWENPYVCEILYVYNFFSPCYTVSGL